MNSRIFLVACLGFSMYSIISSANSDNFISFPILIPFIFLLWLPCPERPKLCWIKVTRMDTLVLFLILEEMLSGFHHWEWCLLWFVINGLYYVEVCSLSFHFLETFYHKCVLNIVKSFSCVYWDDHIVFIIWYITLIDLWMLKNPCIAGINPTDHSVWPF